MDWWAAAPKWEPGWSRNPSGKSGAGGGWSPSAGPKSPSSGFSRCSGSGADRPGLRGSPGLLGSPVAAAVRCWKPSRMRGVLRAVSFDLPILFDRCGNRSRDGKDHRND